MKPRSFRVRLLAVYLFGIFLSALLVGTGAMVFEEYFDKYALENDAMGYAQAISDHLTYDASGRPTGFDETKIEPWFFTSLNQEIAIRILDAYGAVVYSPTGDQAALSSGGAKFAPSAQRFTFEQKGVTLHAATTPLQHKGTTWYVQLAISDRLILLMRNAFVEPALHQGILAMCITFLAVFLVTTHLTLQRMLRPLRVVSEEAQRITPQTLDDRLQTRGLPSELRPLVDAFNSALDRLQQGFRTQQEFLANAAHELKTPLALIRAQIETAPPSERNPHLIQDVDHMARQVQQLLHLAEASELRNYRLELLDPHPVFMEACDYMSRVADHAKVQVRLVADANTGQWSADRGALFTLLKNLLENAIQHSPKDGAVTLMIHAKGFVITDQGSGVPKEHLERLFERFWRGASRRDEGAGLGLSICQEIASAHGWRIEARLGATGLEVHVTNN